MTIPAQLLRGPRPTSCWASRPGCSTQNDDDGAGERAASRGRCWR
ncbi:MAG: hypothetical protein ACLTSG_13635 [Lachnospiraceae bacterium]